MRCQIDAQRVIWNFREKIIILRHHRNRHGISQLYPQSSDAYEKNHISKTLPDFDQFEDRHRSEQTYSSELNIDTENMPSCDDCGFVLESVSDIARQMNRWCPENKKKQGKRG